MAKVGEEGGLLERVPLGRSRLADLCTQKGRNEKQGKCFLFMGERGAGRSSRGGAAHLGRGQTQKNSNVPLSQFGKNAKSRDNKGRKEQRDLGNYQ